MVEMKDSISQGTNTLTVSPIEENVESGTIALEDKIIKQGHSIKINANFLKINECDIKECW